MKETTNYLYQQMIYGFPYAKDNAQYRWDFIFWHMGIEADRLYTNMKGGGGQE